MTRSLKNSQGPVTTEPGPAQKLSGPPKELPLISKQEAIRRASLWWDKTGRILMKSAATQEEINRRSSSSLRGPLIRVQGDKVPSLPSGILNAKLFQELTRPEAVRVVMTWVKVHWQPQEMGRKIFDPRQPVEHLHQELEVTEKDVREFRQRHLTTPTTEGGKPHRPAIEI